MNVDTFYETLGSRIRAARLRYGWCPRLRCYVRIADEVGGFVVEVVPPDDIPSKGGNREYRIWYDDQSAEMADMVESMVGRVIAGRLQRPRAAPRRVDRNRSRIAKEQQQQQQRGESGL